MIQKPIYLDYMATTPVDPLVVQTMLAYLDREGKFGNPASTTHIYGLEANEAVSSARKTIADLIGAIPDEIVFTSGATESNNLAILGSAHFYQAKGKHVITLKSEHKSVLDPFFELEREGFNVTRLNPTANGLLDLDELERALRKDTILVSILHVNNEIGVIQDIEAIGKLLKGRGIIFHVDAAQSGGKIPINLKSLPVDLMSFSAHKMYGPKGIGALFVRSQPRIRLKPLIFGGGHERGLRSGTLATHQIMGFAAAFELAIKVMSEEQTRILALRQKLWKPISKLPNIQLNGDEIKRVAGNLNIYINGIATTNLLPAIPDLAVSATSACSSAGSEASHVLRAIGLSEAMCLSSVRISIGRFTTEEDIDTAITSLSNAIISLRGRQVV